MASSWRGAWWLAVVGIAMCLSDPQSRHVTAQGNDVAIAKAQCGPGSRAETGMQGMWTAAERFSTPARPFNCNVELVGQYSGEGASWSGAMFDACAYIGRNDGPGLSHRGTVIVDATDSRNPKLAGYIDTPGLVEPNESIRLHAGRKLLVGISPYYWFNEPRLANKSDSDLDVYDVTNCRKPVLKATLNLPATRSHGAAFAPDGRTYYATSYTGNIPFNDTSAENAKWRNTKTDAVVAVDVADPSHPREILRWRIPPEIGAAHQISISQDGTKASLFLVSKQYGSEAPEVWGVAVIDVGDVQARKANPQVRSLARSVWNDLGLVQGTWEVRIKGRPYLLGTGGGRGGRKCGQGNPTYGGFPILDVSDPANPKVVSRMLLESSMPGNCNKVLDDPLGRGAFGPNFCAVDNPADTRIVACGLGESGVRVFDIRDPLHPREVAYYKPPVSTGPSRPGSYYSRSSPKMEHTGDNVTVAIGFRKERGEVWFMSLDNGLQIVRFTDWIKSKEKDLF